MNQETSSSEPCLVKAGQGFSVLYNNRYLYSRYNPQAVPLQTIDSIVIPPESLVIVFSPLLGYGLSELAEKTPANSIIVLAEADKTLFDFSYSYLVEHNISFLYINASSPDFFFYKLYVSGFFSTLYFRRCITIELSGASKLNTPIYSSITALVDNAINQFWRNRITLVQLGRLYARNILRNIARLPTSFCLVPHSIERPLLVCGSGPSIDDVLSFIRNEADRFFIISVDNALMPLLKRGIIPDAVFAVESQLANEKAFIGAVNTCVPVIADLTSRPHILSITGGKIAFFLSEYEQTEYLQRIRAEVFHSTCIPPLGSVGLAATEIALTLRASSAVPVFFCGLDFSFIPAKTHCRETPAHRQRLDTHTRLNPLLSLEGSFRNQSVKIVSKDGSTRISSPQLSGYGTSFKMRYSRTENLFDISSAGMDTGCIRCTLEEMILFGKNTSLSGNCSFIAPLPSQTCIEVQDFYTKEISSLEKLRTLLVSGGEESEILNLIKTHEYLYLHFPDGYKEPCMNTGFLNRVRSELDFFIKDCTQALRQCTASE